MMYNTQKHVKIQNILQEKVIQNTGEKCSDDVLKKCFKMFKSQICHL